MILRFSDSTSKYAQYDPLVKQYPDGTEIRMYMDSGPYLRAVDGTVWFPAGDREGIFQWEGPDEDVVDQLDLDMLTEHPDDVTRDMLRLLQTQWWLGTDED